MEDSPVTTLIYEGDDAKTIVTRKSLRVDGDDAVCIVTHVSPHR